MDAAHAPLLPADSDAPAAAPSDTLRVLHLRVTSPTGTPLALQVPWDRTPRDVAHALVAGTDLETPERTVRAFSQGSDDLLDVALREAIRHVGNPEGPGAVVLQVEGPLSSFEGVLTCVELADPRPHQAYPHPLDPTTSERLAPYLAGEGADWFCDGAAGLECCTSTRQAPHEHRWVHY